MPGRHTTPEARATGTARAHWPRRLAAGAGVVVLLAAGSLGVRAMLDDENPCAAQVSLVVSAAPSIAATLRDLAADYAGEEPSVGSGAGRCVDVEVETATTADIKDSLAGGSRAGSLGAGEHPGAGRAG